MVVLGKSDFFPPFCGGVHSFGGFYVEVESPVFFADSGVFGEEGTGLSIAETSDIILVSTEICSFSSSLVLHITWSDYFTLNEQKS